MRQARVGGAIPAVETYAYVPRPFEEECFRRVSGDEWVVVLGPRQHGKTSGLVRVGRRLSDAGIPTAFVDLQAFADSGSDYGTALAWLAGAVAQQLGGGPPVTPSRADDLGSWLAASVPQGSGTVALILDEAAAFPPSHRTRFFSQMRAVYNSSATSAADSVARRLMVVFSGTFDPNELIEGENSPFNVCARVETSDLSLPEAQELAMQLLDADLAARVALEAFELVGGQPYLLQAAFQAAQLDGVQSFSECAPSFVARYLGGADGHLPSLLGPFATDSAALGLLRHLADGGTAPFVSVNSLHTRLRVSGVCRVVDGFLELRNQLYRRFVISLPDVTSEPGESLPTILALNESNFSNVADPTLKDLALTAYAAGYELQQGPTARIALAAFGASMEAILLDYAQRFAPDQLLAAHAAVAAANPGQRVPAQPKDWKLHQLVDGVNAIHPLPGEALAAHTVRDWRNLIHPAKAMRTSEPVGGYGPEASMAASWIVAVLRDLP